MKTTLDHPRTHWNRADRPFRRALRAATMLGVLGVGLTAAPLAAAPLMAQDAAKPTLAVMYFTNSALTGNTDYALLSKGLAEVLITELARNSGIRVVERDRLQDLLDEQDLSASGRVSQSTVVSMGKILGAGHMLMGTFLIDPRENMRIDVRAVNTETSEIAYVESIEGKADKLMAMIGELGEKINSGLKLPARPSGTPGFSDSGGKNPNQFRAMLLLSRAIEEQDKQNVGAAVALYKQAIDANPDFERAKVLLATLERGTPDEQH